MAALGKSMSITRHLLSQTARATHHHPQFLALSNTSRFSSPFSTSRTVRASNQTVPPDNANPSYPAFSLKGIIPNPRMRTAFWVALGVLACVETAAWIKFWPKITGKNSGDGDNDGPFKTA